MLNKQEIENRISNTNEAGLVCILYEALIDNFKDSIKSIQENDYKQLNYINNNSRDILAQLIATLQGNSEIANNLKDLYIYVNKLITYGENNKEKTSFENSIKIITPICEGFQELEKAQKPKVVAGLTYGKNKVEEYELRDNTIFKG